MQLINGTILTRTIRELFRDLYNSLLNTQCTPVADTYFILADFRSYAEAQKRVDGGIQRREETGPGCAMLECGACSGKFSSDRTIQEYVDDIWHLNRIKVDLDIDE